jgi:hypothetical protein
MVWVMPNLDGVVVSEPQFHMHGQGPSPEAAIDDFRHVLVDELESLHDDEMHLSTHLRNQLAYLRSLISPE